MSEQQDGHGFITIAELARRCGVTRQAVWLWSRDGKLGEGVRVGRVKLYRLADVAHLIDAKR